MDAQRSATNPCWPFRLITPLAAASVLLLLISLAPAGAQSGNPILAIDANSTNGTAPCSPVDVTRTVGTGAPVAVAFCLLYPEGAPINGGLSSVDLTVSYGVPLVGTAVASNFTTDLNGNPDWNEGVSPGGASAWDCNVLNGQATAPRAASPARIICDTTNLADQPFSGPEHVATLTFEAPQAAGTSNLLWNSETGLVAGSTGVECDGGSMQCQGASVTVNDGEAAHAPLEFCKEDENKVRRSLNLGLTRDQRAVAVALPLTEYGFKSGVTLVIETVFAGKLDPKMELLADVEGFDCIAERVWAPHVPVLAVFVITPQVDARADLFTLSGWPLLKESGVTLSSADLLDPDLDVPSLRVAVPGEPSVQELFDSARRFVEPTETPLPPGVPTRAPIQAIDVGGTGLVGPDTGATLPREQAGWSGSPTLLAVGAVGALFIFSGVAVVFMGRKNT